MYFLIFRKTRTDAVIDGDPQRNCAITVGIAICITCDSLVVYSLRHLCKGKNREGGEVKEQEIFHAFVHDLDVIESAKVNFNTPWDLFVLHNIQLWRFLYTPFSPTNITIIVYTSVAVPGSRSLCGYS